MERRTKMTDTMQTNGDRTGVRGAGRVSAVDAAQRTGLAGGAQEMVLGHPTAAAAGGVDLAGFVGGPVGVVWPQLTVLERGTF